ncbi:alpha/beta fold hydrolase [Streptomyces sp. NPDC091272]|uniref:alpha/beta fold hydrolase n=1 Tax=Streptomyces sp. NPDC091272 TaxID=3365981 RepID=UPI00381D5C15
MPQYRSYDDTALSYRVLGPAGLPLVCLSGGPGRDAAHLGDLGGLDRAYRLLVPGPRPAGGSPQAAGPGRPSLPPLPQDLEALRSHLRLERFALLAHGAAAATAQSYAAAHPERLSHLVLVCPEDRDRRTVPVESREVTCPVLVVTGEQDTISGVRIGQPLAASFPRGEWRRLSGVGHHPWVDDPEIFRAAVGSFLGEL